MTLKEIMKQNNRAIMCYAIVLSIISVISYTATILCAVNNVHIAIIITMLVVSPLISAVCIGTWIYFALDRNFIKRF